MADVRHGSRRGADPRRRHGSRSPTRRSGSTCPAAGARKPAKHRLVTIGDSLTHGFMSAAIYRTDLSWPAITAYELGLTAEEFTFPTYEWPTGPGGLPLDLERLARAFEKRYGDRLDFWEIVGAAAVGPFLPGPRRGLLGARRRLRRPARRGRRSTTWRVYGWDLLDPQLLTATTVAARLAASHEGRLPRPARRAPPGPRRLAGPPAGAQGQPRDAPCSRPSTDLSPARRGGGDPGGRCSGPTTRWARCVSLSPAWTPGRLRRRCRRSSGSRPGSAATCGDPAPSPPTGSCSCSACAASRPST